IGNKPHVCGDQITIADYFGSCIVTAGEIVGCKYDGFANVQRWIGSMKKLTSWAMVNEVMYGFANSLKDKKFETL
ncbi:MAG: glutathione S-transferase family protein, partial [Kofleriaceae bacterium]